MARYEPRAGTARVPSLFLKAGHSSEGVAFDHLPEKTVAKYLFTPFDSSLRQPARRRRFSLFNFPASLDKRKSVYKMKLLTKFWYRNGNRVWARSKLALDFTHLRVGFTHLLPRLVLYTDTVNFVLRYWNLKVCLTKTHDDIRNNVDHWVINAKKTLNS